MSQQPLEQVQSTETNSKTAYQGGDNLTNGPSVIDGRRYPRGGDYEAQFFATQEVPDFKKVARIGNPTSLPVASFAISLTIASMGLMGWGDMQLTTTFAAVGVYTFAGGLGMLIGCVLEIIAGNAFGYCVFGCFGCYWLSLGAVFNQSFGVAATAAAIGSTGTRDQNIGLAFWQITFCIINLIFLICSVRTNLVLFGIFFCLEPAFILLAVLLGGTTLSASTLTAVSKAAGAFGFVTSLLGYYLLLSILMAEVGHGVKLPVGDMTNFWSKRDGTKKE